MTDPYFLRQGGYVQWKQDDETNPAMRYTQIYRYDGTNPHDRAIGPPKWIRFKYDMFPITPTTAQNRTDIQIHPDGECNDPNMGGTAGCIGIQTWDGCNAIHKILRIYHGLKVKVQLQ
jgi:hypothetical protein